MAKIRPSDKFSKCLKISIEKWFDDAIMQEKHFLFVKKRNSLKCWPHN